MVKACARAACGGLGERVYGVIFQFPHLDSGNFLNVFYTWMHENLWFVSGVILDLKLSWKIGSH